jgi:hypothetical protein
MGMRFKVTPQKSGPTVNDLTKGDVFKFTSSGKIKDVMLAVVDWNGESNKQGVVLLPAGTYKVGTLIKLHDGHVEILGRIEVDD